MVIAQHPRFIANAIEVVTTPARFGDKPALRTCAWAILMGQRGKRIDQLQIRRMQAQMGATPRPAAVTSC